MADLGERPRLSREFLLGQLRAALRPSRISLVEVRRLLRVAVLMGYNAAELYEEASAGRPETYGPVPLLVRVLPRDLPKEARLDLTVGKVMTSRSPSPRDLKAVGLPEDRTSKKLSSS